MASNSKNNHNKQEKVQYKSKLELSDCTCPICLYVLIEPVTLPCGHELCMNCFDTNVRETSLLCPMCRMRIASWARRAARNQNLINQNRWKAIQLAFPRKVQCRLEGIEDGSSSDSEEDFVINQICEPGEIRKEYEDEMKRLQEERDRQQREEDEASARLIAAMQADEFTRQLEQERQTLSDEAMAREISQTQQQTTPLCLSSTVTSAPLEKKTPNLLEKFVRKRPGDETNRNNNSVTTVLDKSGSKPDGDPYPYACYTPRDYGKIITSEDVTTDQYPFVDVDALQRKQKREKEQDSGQGESEKTGKTEEETLLDFIFIDSREPTPMGHREQEVETTEAAPSAFCNQEKVKLKLLDNTYNQVAVPTAGQSQKAVLKNWLTSDLAVTNKTSQDQQFKGPASIKPLSLASSSAVRPVRRESDEENSFGNDSIGPEMCHFRPVKTYPKTSPERLPGGGLLKTSLVRSQPSNISYKPKHRTSPTAENLNPAKLGHSPLMQRHLLELQAERRLQVNLQSKATSTSLTSISTPLKKLDQFAKAKHTPAETVTMGTAASAVLKPSNVVRAHYFWKTTGGKPGMEMPDSTVVIGDSSESGSSDVLLIEDSPTTQIESLLEDDKVAGKEPLLPILPLDPQLHDYHYPQLDYEESDCIVSKIEPAAREKSETTSSSIMALLDTGQNKDCSGIQNEPFTSQLLSETTRSDAANLSLLGGYKGGEQTIDSLFGTKGEDFVVTKPEEPRLTSFSNVITPIKCQRDSPADLHLDNFACAQIREESLDKLEEKSEHSSSVKGNPPNTTVPRDDSPAVSSNVQSSPRSKVYRMKRAPKTTTSHAQSKASTSRNVVCLALTKSPVARSSKAPSDRNTMCGAEGGLSTVEQLKRDLDVPVMSPDVGVQEWLQNHTYMAESHVTNDETSADKSPEQDETAASADVADTRVSVEDRSSTSENETGSDATEEMDCEVETVKNVPESAVEAQQRNLPFATMGNLDNLGGNGKCAGHVSEEEVRLKENHYEVKKAGQVEKQSISSDCHKTDHAEGSVSHAGDMDCSSPFPEDSLTQGQDHTYFRCVLPGKISPIPTTHDSCSEKANCVASINKKDLGETSSHDTKKTVYSSCLVSQTLTRGDTGEFSIQTGGEVHRKDVDVSTVIKPVGDNNVSVVGASSLATKNMNSLKMDSSGRKRIFSVKDSPEESVKDCSPAKKQKWSREMFPSRKRNEETVFESEETRRMSLEATTAKNHGCLMNTPVLQCPHKVHQDAGEDTSENISYASGQQQCGAEITVVNEAQQTLQASKCFCRHKNHKVNNFLFEKCLCAQGVSETVEENLPRKNLQSAVDGISNQKKCIENDKVKVGKRKSDDCVMEQDNNDDVMKVEENPGSKVKSHMMTKVKGKQEAEISSAPSGVKDTVGERMDIWQNAPKETICDNSLKTKVLHKPPTAGGRKQVGDPGSMPGIESCIVGTVARKRGRPCKKTSQSHAEPHDDQVSHDSEGESGTASKTICISSRTRSKTPTKAQTPSKKLFGAPYKKIISQTRVGHTPIKSCESENTHKKMDAGRGEDISHRTRSRSTPVKGLEQGVTPSKRIDKGVTPSKRLTKVVTPSKGKNKGVTPSKGIDKGVTPSKRMNKGVTPSKRINKGVTPSKRINKGVTPSKRTNKGVTPRKEMTKKSTPYKVTKRGVSPGKVIEVTPSEMTNSKTINPGQKRNKGSTPIKRKHQGVTPHKSIFKGVAPNNGPMTNKDQKHSKVANQKDNSSEINIKGEKYRKKIFKGVTPRKQTSEGVTPKKTCDKEVNPEKSSKSKCSSGKKGVAPKKDITEGGKRGKTEKQLNKMKRSTLNAGKGVGEGKLCSVSCVDDENIIAGNDTSPVDEVFSSEEEASDAESVCSRTRSKAIIATSRNKHGRKASKKQASKQKTNLGVKGSVGKVLDKAERTNRWNNSAVGKKKENRRFASSASDPLFSESDDEACKSKRRKLPANQEVIPGEQSAKMEQNVKVGRDRKPCSTHQNRIQKKPLSLETELQPTSKNVEYSPTDNGKKRIISSGRQRGSVTKVQLNDVDKAKDTKKVKDIAKVKDVKKTTQTTLMFVGQNSEDEFQETVNRVKKVLTFGKMKQEQGETTVSKPKVKGSRPQRRSDAVFSASPSIRDTKNVDIVCNFSETDVIKRFAPKTSALIGNIKRKNSKACMKQSKLTQSDVNKLDVNQKSKSVGDYSSGKVNCVAWKGLESPRRPVECFRTRLEYECYVEEQDRLLALKLQADFDMEAKFHLTAIRRKGSSDEYKLRRKQRRTVLT